MADVLLLRSPLPEPHVLSGRIARGWYWLGAGIVSAALWYGFITLALVLA